MRSACFVAMVLGMAGVADVHAQAQDKSAGSVLSRTYAFNISAKPLLAALTDFSEVTGIQLVYPSGDALKVRSQAVSGTYSAEQALRLMLAGTGIDFRLASSGTITLQKAGSDTRVLGPVRVEGQTGSTAGANGSRDPTATEGTRSYTSSALQVASKTAQSMRDTPQSVSVITQQRMQDQNLTDFNAVMRQAPGITITNSANEVFNYYSRGFAVQSIQFDGGAPLALSFGDETSSATNYIPQIDMSIYDHVELLRGADGLFNGYGKPSGSINLVRKRPLDHQQVRLESTVASWNDYRVSLDASTPLALDGRLRGRGVLTYQDKDYFYDGADLSRSVIYGIAELDVSATTLLSAGIDFAHQDSTPWFGGLPRYQNGDDLHLPRDTCLCLSWNKWNFDTRDVFLQLQQQLGSNWSLKVNVTRSEQEGSRKVASSGGTVNPVTLKGAQFTGTKNELSDTQLLGDVTMTGGFELFGNRQELVFGASYQHSDSGDSTSYRALYGTDVVAPSGTVGFPQVDVFHFNRDDAAFREPADSLQNSYSPLRLQTTWNAYATAKLTPWKPFHVITGLRYSTYRFDTDTQTLCNVATPISACGGLGVVYKEERSIYSGSDFSWPPTYSLVYDLNDNWSVYGSYTDIYLSQDNYVDANLQPLQPLTGSNFEGGVKFEGGGGKLNASLSAYRIEQKNFYRFLGYGDYAGTRGKLPDGVRNCCYSNESNKVLRSQGADLEVTGEVSTGLQLSASYTFNDNEYLGSDSASNLEQPLVTLQPRQLLKLWGDYRFQQGDLFHRLSIGGGINGQTASYTSGSACIDYTYGNDATGQPTATCKKSAPFAYTQKAYVTVAARAAYQINKTWNASLNINNLTDKRYYQTMGSSAGNNWYGAPRSFAFTLRGAF